MTCPSSSCARSRVIGAPANAGEGEVALSALISPPPREREGDHDEQDNPSQRHPPCGVEPHEVGAAARLRLKVVPAPSTAAAVDVVFALRIGAVVRFGDLDLAGTALCGSSGVGHQNSSSAVASSRMAARGGMALGGWNSMMRERFSTDPASRT